MLCDLEIKNDQLCDLENTDKHTQKDTLLRRTYLE